MEEQKARRLFRGHGKKTEKKMKQGESVVGKPKKKDRESDEFPKSHDTETGYMYAPEVMSPEKDPQNDHCPVDKNHAPFVEEVNNCRQYPIAIAKTAYSATCQEELDLAPGDLLYLVHKTDENMYFAETVESKKRGLVHANLIELQANHPVEPDPAALGFNAQGDERCADSPKANQKDNPLGPVKRCFIQDCLVNELQQKMTAQKCGAPPQSPSQERPPKLPVRRPTFEVEPDSKEANEDKKMAAPSRPAFEVAETAQCKPNEDKGMAAPSQPSPVTKVSRRKPLWLIVENIPDNARADALDFKKGDVLRWIDYDPNYLKPTDEPLPSDEFLECETWSGNPVVVPSGFVRLLTSNVELTEALARRPRAEVIENFSASHDSQLSVRVGEVIYLLADRSSTDFLAMNKSGIRGEVPKSVLNVLVAPK